jgi:hypothetical protein
VRSFIDEFGVQENRKVEVPASKSESFSPIKDRDELNEEDQKGFQSGVVNWRITSRITG